MAEDLWGVRSRENLAGHPLGWLDHSWIVHHRVFPMILGERGQDPSWVDIPPALGVPKGGRWFDFGCGGGNIEIQMARAGLFDEMVAVDASPGSIEVARAQALEQGIQNIHFDVQDADSLELAPEFYDVIHANMALHHVERLEHVCAEINKALKPGGVFILNEYVGPNRFQFSDARLEAVRQLLAKLPDELRWNPLAGELKGAYPRYPVEHWLAYDPTEAVRSADIPKVLARQFPRLRRYEYGGNMLNLVLENIVHNFRPDEEPGHREYLEDLFCAEDELLRGESSDFAYFVCPRGSAVTRLRGQLAARRRSLASRLSSSDPAPASSQAPADDLGVARIRARAVLHAGTAVGSARPVVGPAVAITKRGLRRALRWYVGSLREQQTEVNQEVVAVLDRVRERLDSQATELSLLRAELDAARGYRGDSPPVSTLVEVFHRPVLATEVSGGPQAVLHRPDGVYLAASLLPEDDNELADLLADWAAVLDGGGQLLAEVPGPEAAERVLGAARMAGLAHPRIEAVKQGSGAAALLLRAWRG